MGYFAVNASVKTSCLLRRNCSFCTISQDVEFFYLDGQFVFGRIKFVHHLLMALTLIYSFSMGIGMYISVLVQSL